MSLLGIDVGTTGCKAAVFSEGGELLHAAYREYATLHRRPGEAELDSHLVWRRIKEAIAEAARHARRDPVTALSVSAMGEAVTPVGPDRTILGDCILSSDLRGEEYLATFLKKFDPAELYRINPNIPAVNTTLPKLRWLQEHRPELYAKTECFLYWGGLVEHLLGSEPFVSHSHANRSLLFDIRREDWSDALLQAGGIDRAKLPPCLPSGVIAGRVSDRTADELGLARGIRIVVGGHDQCLNSLGAGAITPGSAVDGIGTFECITPVYQGIPPASDQWLTKGLNLEHHVLPGLYVSFLYNQAGSLVRWFRNTFASEAREERDIYSRLDAEIPDAPTRLMLLPAFEMTGSPGFIEDASGLIAGLKINTSRGEILKAIMENVTYYFRSSLLACRTAGIAPAEFIATGGGARSDRWLKIKADIMGATYVRLRSTEGGVTGAAMLAGLATGVYSTPGEAVECFVHRERSFEPDPGRQRLYDERFALYEELFPRFYPFLRKLNALSSC